MMAIPAIDLRDGACVQLVGGDYDRERVRIADAVGQAKFFRAQGFSWIHLVDLDAATGRKDWQFESGAAFSASPAISAGRIVIGDTDGRIYAIGG